MEFLQYTRGVHFSPGSKRDIMSNEETQYLDAAKSRVSFCNLIKIQLSFGRNLHDMHEILENMLYYLKISCRMRGHKHKPPVLGAQHENTLRINAPKRAHFHRAFNTHTNTAGGLLRTK